MTKKLLRNKQRMALAILRTYKVEGVNGHACLFCQQALSDKPYLGDHNDRCVVLVSWSVLNDFLDRWEVVANRVEKALGTNGDGTIGEMK